MNIFGQAVYIYNITIQAILSISDNLLHIVRDERALLSEDLNAAIEKAMFPLTTRLEKSEDRIHELENKAVQVVFSTAMGLGPYHFPPKTYNTDKALIFNRVITNIGGAYKIDRGHFVAPYAGIYYFVFFVHTGENSGTNLYLYKGKERIVQVQNHPLAKEKAANGGNAAFLELKKNDYVYLSLDKDSHVWASHTHTTFSGFLVARTEDEGADSPT